MVEPSTVNAGTLRSRMDLDSTRSIFSSASGRHAFNPLDDTHWEPGLKQNGSGMRIIGVAGNGDAHVFGQRIAPTKLGRRPSSPATDRWSIWRLCTAVKLTGRAHDAPPVRDGLTKGPLRAFQAGRLARIMQKTGLIGVCFSKDTAQMKSEDTRWSTSVKAIPRPRLMK